MDCVKLSVSNYLKRFFYILSSQNINKFNIILWCCVLVNLKKMEGTDNIDTMTRMSRLQPISSEIINILLSDGSSGNSTILRPSVVSLPVLSSAPRIHN